MNNKKTGLFIAQRRKELNLSQKQLAELLSVTDKAVSKWETGKGAPDIGLLLTIADTLGVSVVELLDGGYAEKTSEKEQIDKIIMQSLQKAKKERIKSVMSIILIILVLFVSINIIAYVYWGRRHKVLYDVDRVYVHQQHDNPKIYDLYYNVKVKNWWFDFVTHTYKLENGLSGEPGMWHFEAKTEYFESSSVESSFVIHVEYDKATAGRPVEIVAKMAVFYAYTSSELYDERANLFMADFPDAEIVFV